MAAPVNYWKIGLFASLGIAVAFISLVALGASKFDEVRLGFVTYFDESVSGLEVGSPVKFRGAPIGRVDGIRVAPDRRHVEVNCSVTVTALKRLGLRPDEDDPSRGADPDQFVPPELRTQLVSAALTGTKFVQIDFFDVKQHKLPGLSFPIPKNYIPAVPSTLASLESSLTATADRLPSLVKQASEFLTKLEKFVDKIDVKRLNDTGVETLTEARDLLKELRTELRAVDAPSLSKRGNDLMVRADRILARIDAKDGLLDDLEKTVEEVRAELKRLELGKSVKRTVASMDDTLEEVEKAAKHFGDVAKDNRNLGTDLSRTLTELRRAAKAIRKLADTLDRDSDMLLKGRSRK